MVGETTDPGLNVTGALEQKLRWGGGRGGEQKVPPCLMFLKLKKARFR